MQITELRETIEGDPCITFYHYDAKTNTKYYSSTFVIQPQFNKLKLKRQFCKYVQSELDKNKGLVIKMRPAFARPSAN